MSQPPPSRPETLADSAPERTPSKQELLAKLAPHAQQHVLAFWDQLSANERQVFAQQLERLDLPLVQRLFQATDEDQELKALAERAVPPPAIRLARSADETRAAELRGAEALRQGRLAVVLVAGGQGTRLGSDDPKGMYAIGPVSGSSLFRILLEKVLAVGRRFGVTIPTYVMTSDATHHKTAEYLSQEQGFGICAHDLTIVCQGNMPAVDAATGRLLLATPGSLALSPDGHGGLLAALRASSALDDMRRRGVDLVFYLQVDNPLVQVCDPEFIGHHLIAGSQLSTQVVAKQAAADRVGCVVAVDGRLRIIEYSDLPSHIAERQNADGSLALWAGNIAVHLFDLELLEQTSTIACRLPFHRAHKKVSYLQPDGKLVEPAAPNAIKFEQFIFDLLPRAERAIVVEVDRRTAYAPVKNAPGSASDSPEAVRHAISALHASWLREASVTVSDGVQVEISPLFASSQAEVAARVRAGDRVTSDHFFAPRAMPDEDAELRVRGWLAHDPRS